MTTEVEELFFNGGWCYGGFKATPASGFCYAHLLATNNSHEVAQLTSWIDLGAALLLMRRALALNQTYTKEDKT